MMNEINKPEIQLYSIGNIAAKDAQVVFEILEKPNWAPWLAASPQTIAGRAEVFPAGQLLAKDIRGFPMACLSMNRINWNGDPASLPSWDEVAGDPTTYENTYKPEGNTLALMSMNVNPDHQREGYARKLIEQAKLLGLKLPGISYVIGSFRPNEYGKYKLEGSDHLIDFNSYCEMRREDGLPVDGWLRNLTRNGMKPIKVDPKAMVVTLSLEEFLKLQKSHYSLPWVEISPGTWECGEVGNWVLDNEHGTVIYKESNLWGKL